MNKKKKILLFIDWFLPGYKAGGPIQSCANLIDHLKDEFDFSVVTTNTDYCETVPYPNIKNNDWNVLENGCRVYYFSADQLNKRNIQHLIKKEQADIIYLNGIFSFYFTLIPIFLAKRESGIKIIVAARGMLAPSALAIKKTKKRLFLTIIKIVGLFKGVLFHATTDQEEQEIKTELGKHTQIKIAPNFPKKISSKNLSIRKKEIGFVKIVNIARIAPEKNLKYALEVLHKVKGNVEFDIYGPIYNELYWKECLVLIESMPSNIKVHYKQSIESDKILPLLENYHFMFMPTQGENFGHIIIEAMSAGCPVIISDQTVWRNLNEKNLGWDISLSNKLEFVKVIDTIANMNQDDYKLMSNNAFNFSLSIVNNAMSINKNRDLFDC